MYIHIWNNNLEFRRLTANFYEIKLNNFFRNENIKWNVENKSWNLDMDNFYIKYNVKCAMRYKWREDGTTLCYLHYVKY